MPWVRLHAAKDYLDMAQLAGEFQGIRLTFNLTPVLLDQIGALVAGENDGLMEVAAKNTSDLVPSERAYLLRYCFMVNRERRIMPSRRYRELAAKRGEGGEAFNPIEAEKEYSEQELRDLVVLFHLAWTGGLEMARNAELRGLAEKGEGYSEEEKKYCLEVQRRLLSEVIPCYRKMQDAGVLELTTTPFYHPISPLLINQETARESRPEMKMPSKRFDGRRDAEWQIDSALSLHEKLFGRSPAGMWPAEGGVSGEFINMAASRGIKWLATDEAVLLESLRRDRIEAGPAPHLEPYIIGETGTEAAVFFRDRQLSDSIGFKYSHWDPGMAASDFMGRVKALGAEKGDGGIVTVVLDGENAWEAYQNDGKDFLRALYAALKSDTAVKSVTPGSYLDGNNPKKRLKKIIAGSWINRDFAIWIGHKEDHRAWELMSDTREALIKAEKEITPEAFKAAWKNLMRAEGSDWTWWYGDEHFTPMAGEFDRLFRENLAAVYREAGAKAPAELMQAIKPETGGALMTPQTAFMERVEIDGAVSSYFEWLNAAFYDVRRVSSEMHRGVVLIRGIYFGMDSGGQLFIRIDPNDDEIQNIADNTSYIIRILEPLSYDIVIKKAEISMVSGSIINEDWSIRVEYRWGSIIEANIAILGHRKHPGMIKFGILAKGLEDKEWVIEQWPKGNVFIANRDTAEMKGDWIA